MVLCGRLSNQIHTQGEEKEGMQGQKPSRQSRLGMIHQMKMKLNTRGMAASIQHRALLICALWHEVTSTQALVRVIVMMMKNLPMNNLFNPFYEVCTNKKKAQLSELKNKSKELW
jgi:hypothetical protein